MVAWRGGVGLIIKVWEWVLRCDGWVFVWPWSLSHHESWTNVEVLTHVEVNLWGELKKETWGGSGKIMQQCKGGGNDNSKEMVSWRGLLKARGTRFGF